MKKFTNLYPLSKTLRFELRPIGKTLENIEKQGLLKTDEHRAESYIKVKKIIDEYHKAFIKRVLENVVLICDNEGKDNSLREFYDCYLCNAKDDKLKKRLVKIQDKLREQIATSFTNDAYYKRIFKQELIKEDLLKFVTNPEDFALVEEFQNFITYFSGFHENRKNMYSPDVKSTAIAYRLIHENLPKFIDNILVFEKIASSPIVDSFDELLANFKDYLTVESISELFELSFFNNVLTQKQIDVYNAIIGGKTLDDNTKIKGLNEYINLYNQQQKDKSARLPKFKQLFKQILSDRNAISWLPESFKTDEELLEAIGYAYQDFKEHICEQCERLLKSLNTYDLSKIYIRNDQQLTNISQAMFGDWSVISNAFLELEKQTTPKKKKETQEKYEERLKKDLNKKGNISIAQINEALSGGQKERTVQEYFGKLGAMISDGTDKLSVLERIERAYNEAAELLQTTYQGKNLAQDKPNVEKIKNLLDALKSLQHFVKPLLGDGMMPDKDERFYGEFVALYEELDTITPLYNMVRNYLTRKPYSTEKIKLNFENSTLMNGWDLNKESDNTTIILRRNGLYYLAIMNCHHNKVFDVKNLPSVGECYEKMEYKLLPGPNKMLPKVFFSKSRIDEFAPSETILAIRESETFKKSSANFSLQDCHMLIDFFKKSINKHSDWRNFEFQFTETEQYNDISDFYKEVEQQGYKISFRQVSVDYINQLVEEGKIYLFQIYNKDFSPHSKGTPNLHTLYWKMLFDERNLADVVYKLNGEAEVFYRKKSLEKHTTHPAGEPIRNKNKLNAKKESQFEYDLIKDKRYTEDKFQFHVPITMNFKSVGKEKLNDVVNEYIRTCDDLHIIGIDRGERHLLYLTVINLKGEIKEQYSLNEIVNEYNGTEYRTDYHSLLDEREKDRTKERQSWRTIENIKELKEGYLSQVVRKIAELMLKYKAIVVLEDLNVGFMRGRQKVEKSVYQKFEKMLIDKLNYLVDKKKLPEDPGGLLHAYQLTAKVDSLAQMGKQCGFLFYVQAWNTSKIDPVTGFVNLFDTRYENLEKAKAFFSNFDSISYNLICDRFEFKFDYTNFTGKAKDSRTDWTLCTVGNRIETRRDSKQNSQWSSKELNLTEEFKSLFDEFAIDVNDDLKYQIGQQDSADFFKRLLSLLKLTLQMRNSESGTERDYLQSPVVDENGRFYNSETCDDSLPKNADANGAYNIARKGLWTILQIKKTGKFAPIKNEEWLQFAQQKPYLD